MKIIRCMLIILLLANNRKMTAHEPSGSTPLESRAKVTVAIEQGLQRQLYYPSFLDGERIYQATVLLRSTQEGKFQIIFIHTENALLSAFLREQLEQMSIGKTHLSPGEIFRFQLSFNRQH